LDVSLLVNAEADVDDVLLVDGDVVDHVPEGVEEDGDQGQDAGVWQLCSRGEFVLGEEDDPECGGEVEWHEQEDVDGREPPCGLVVEDQEELEGDVVASETNSEGANQDNTTLNGAAAAAAQVCSLIGAASAKAAAAWLKLGLGVFRYE